MYRAGVIHFLGEEGVYSNNIPSQKCHLKSNIYVVLHIECYVVKKMQHSSAFTMSYLAVPFAQHWGVQLEALSTGTTTWPWTKTFHGTAYVKLKTFGAQSPGSSIVI